MCLSELGVFFFSFRNQTHCDGRQIMTIVMLVTVVMLLMIVMLRVVCHAGFVHDTGGGHHADDCQFTNNSGIHFSDGVKLVDVVAHW